MIPGEKKDISALYLKLELDPSEYKEFPSALSIKQKAPDLDAPLPVRIPAQAAEPGVSSPEDGIKPKKSGAADPISTIEGLRLLNRSSVNEPNPAQARIGLAASLKSFIEERPACWKAAAPSRALPVFSAAGGVGTTTILATLAKSLALDGETVLLLDGHRSLLSLYFGGEISCDEQISFQTTSPFDSMRMASVRETARAEGEIHILNAFAPANQEEQDAPEWDPAASLNRKLLHYAGRATCVLADVPLATPLAVQCALLAAGVAVVVLTPDLRSLVSLGPLLSHLDKVRSKSGEPISIYYLLNQFDSSLPIHRELYNVLREQLNSSLLPFVVQRSDDFANALALGKTIAEFPEEVANKRVFEGLAAWIKPQLRETRSDVKTELIGATHS